MTTSFFLFLMFSWGLNQMDASLPAVGGFGSPEAAAFERTAAAHATRTRDGGVASPRAGRPVQARDG